MDCHKIRYNTKKEAKTHFKTMKNLIGRGKPSYYICESCNKWHRTSLTKAKRKSFRKILNNIGIRTGQIWEYENGNTIEIIEPPKTLKGLGLFQYNFTLVKDSKYD